MLSNALLRPVAAFRRVVRGQIDFVRRSIALFVAMDGVDRAMALAAQAFTALIPLIIIVAVVTEGGDGDDLGDRIVDRFELSGATAAGVQRALPSKGTVEDGLSGLSVLILIISALSFTRALQRMYARAWDLEIRTMRDAPWGLAWLLGFSLFAALQPLLRGELSGGAGLAASLVGGALFWLVTPYVILARRLPWRRLVPQAVLAALGMDALGAASAIYMPHALSSSAKQFGSLGIAFTFISWLFFAGMVITATAAMGAALSRTRPSMTRA